MRKTPPVPAQLPLRPKEVTPATTLLSPRKLGPPESPKQVPPVEWLAGLVFHRGGEYNLLEWYARLLMGRSRQGGR